MRKFQSYTSVLTLVCIMQVLVGIPAKRSPPKTGLVAGRLFAARLQTIPHTRRLESKAAFAQLRFCQ